jgi:hypothetical protein
LRIKRVVIGEFGKLVAPSVRLALFCPCIGGPEALDCHSTSLSLSLGAAFPAEIGKSAEGFRLAPCAREFWKRVAAYKHVGFRRSSLTTGKSSNRRAVFRWRDVCASAFPLGQRRHSRREVRFGARLAGNTGGAPNGVSSFGANVIGGIDHDAFYASSLFAVGGVTHR